MVPGWRDLRDAPLEEICAQQYIASNEAVLDARSAIDPARWVDVAYEDLVDDPTVVLGHLYERLGLTFGADAMRFAASLGDNLAATTLTAPRPDKWREQNPELIERVLARVMPTERRLGYPESLD